MKLLKPRKPAPRQGRARKGEGSLKLRGSNWWYKIPGAGKGAKPIEGSCETSDYATALIRKAEAIVLTHKRIAAPVAVPATTKEILDEYVADLEAKARYKQNAEPEFEAKKSMSAVTAATRHLAAFFGDVLADNLTTGHTVAFRRKRETKDGVLFSTVNHELAYLRAAFKRGMESTPPRVSRVPKMWFPSEKSQVREGFIEREEHYLPILKVLPDSLAAIFVVAFHTGARSGELKRLRWDMVKWERKTIQIRAKTAKNGDGRWLPIWGDMLEILKWQKSVRDRDFPDCPWVFFWHHGDVGSRGEAGTQLPGFTRQWKKAVTSIDLPDIIFHDLRRSAIRYADQEVGIDPASVMKMSGHKSQSVYGRYNIRGERDVSNLAAKFDAHLSTTGGIRAEGLHLVKKSA